MSCESYDKYVEARDAANEIQDKLLQQGLTKDEIFSHPEWLAATKAEHEAYVAHLKDDQAA